MQRLVRTPFVCATTSALLARSVQHPTVHHSVVTGRCFATHAAAAEPSSASTDGSSSSRQRHPGWQRSRQTQSPKQQPPPPNKTTTATKTTTTTARRLNNRDDLSPQGRQQLRLADPRVGSLLRGSLKSNQYVNVCKALRAKNGVALLTATDPRAWNIALTNRVKRGDVHGARALLELLLDVGTDHMDDKLWGDLLFTLMRQRSQLTQENEIVALLRTLQMNCGDAFVAGITVSLVEGCTNIKMFTEAQFLVAYHKTLTEVPPMPSSIVAILALNMVTYGRHDKATAFVEKLVGGDQRIPVDQIDGAFWLTLFRSGVQAQADLSQYVDRVIEWFDVWKKRPQSERPAFDGVLGIAVQSCMTSSVSGHEHAALRCYHGLTRDDEDDMDASSLFHQRIVYPDENVYVNVLKACSVVGDKMLFKEIYRRMARDKVARSGGFGSAIRFCHVHHDVSFLQQVMEDAFVVEDEQEHEHGEDGWFLPLEQYNDALGCCAETKNFELASDYFGRLLDDPRLVPTHITMVEMVENYREQPFSEVFELMELFLEFNLTPNLQVFTSLLASCGRHRVMADAMALVEAMKHQGVRADIKTFTAVGFIYGTHGQVAGLVDMLQEMRAQGVKTDALFFDIVLDGLVCGSGTDMCFAFLRGMLEAGLPIPEGMYRSLVRMGTKAGLVERTLHIAYNMECDGFALTSEELLGLMERCESDTEVAELVRVFLLLHQGKEQDDVVVGSEEDMMMMPPNQFTYEVYEEMTELLAAFSKRDAANQIRRIAEKKGYYIP